MATGTGAGSDTEKYDNGLVKGHAYSLLGGISYNDIFNLIKLRNPWGFDYWNGSYNDKDEFWKEKEYVDHFQFEKKQLTDGIFHINNEDYAKNFSCTIICHIFNGATIKNYRLNSPEDFTSPSVFKFTLDKDNTMLHIPPNFEKTSPKLSYFLLYS